MRGIIILLIIVLPLASKEGKDLDVADYEESSSAILSFFFPFLVCSLLLSTSAVSCCPLTSLKFDTD